MRRRHAARAAPPAPRSSRRPRCPPPRPPQGTTSNGSCLLPFKTGAFLAGLPVQPIILRYGEVGGRIGGWMDPDGWLDGRHDGARAGAGGRGRVARRAPSPCERARPSRTPPAPRAQGAVSPAWESIGALRHLLLMLTAPFHSVTAYELPPYFPNEGERGDPKLFAAGVRQYMVSVVCA